MTIDRVDYIYQYDEDNSIATITEKSTNIMARISQENIQGCNESVEYLDKVIKHLFIDTKF